MKEKLPLIKKKIVCDLNIKKTKNHVFLTTMTGTSFI